MYPNLVLITSFASKKELKNVIYIVDDCPIIVIAFYKATHFHDNICC